MKRIFFFFLFILNAATGWSQHCPWDCSGMILIQTDIPSEMMKTLNLTLVDEKDKGIVDTIFGTGSSKTRDLCEFMGYEDFTAYRKKKMDDHHYYMYDTAYVFAKDKFMVKYNYCEYRDKKLYISYLHPYRRDLYYVHIEIPENKRIHLHDYSTRLHDKNYKEIEKDVEPFVINLNCRELGLYEDDCRQK